MSRRSFLMGVLGAVLPAALLTGCGAGGKVKEAMQCQKCKGTGRCQECLKHTYVLKRCPECRGTHKCGGCSGNGW